MDDARRSSPSRLSASRNTPSKPREASRGLCAGFRETDGAAFYILRPFDKREALSVPDAARIAGRSASTIRVWCEQFGIGRRIAGGNWMISRVALAMLLDGDLPALAAYHAGKRDGVVAAYFLQCDLGELVPLALTNS